MFFYEPVYFLGFLPPGSETLGRKPFERQISGLQDVGMPLQHSTL